MWILEMRMSCVAMVMLGVIMFVSVSGMVAVFMSVVLSSVRMVVVIMRMIMSNMRVVMSMVCMSKGKHSYQIDNKTKTANS